MPFGIVDAKKGYDVSVDYAVELAIKLHSGRGCRARDMTIDEIRRATQQATECVLGYIAWRCEAK